MTAASAPASPSARLRAEAAGLLESAERDQIEPGGTLGHWLRGQEAALLALADMTDHIDRAAQHLEERVHAAIKNTRELSISEVHKLQEATTLANATVQSLKSAEAVVKLRTDQAVSNLVETMKPDLIKALRTTTVIHQKGWNLRQNLIGVVSAACLLLGLFGVGYVMGGGDLRSRWDGDLARAAVSRCESAAKAGGAPEAFSCPMTTLNGTRVNAGTQWRKRVISWP